MVVLVDVEDVAVAWAAVLTSTSGATVAAIAVVIDGGGGNGIAGTSNVNGRPRPSCRGNRI